jgi:PKD repeat protein
MLIALVATAVAVIAVTVLSQPPPEKIPALEAVISNTGNTVQILHNGGDTLQYTDFQVMIDGQAVALPAGPDKTWSSGETLTFEAPGARTVQILYTKDGAATTAVMTSTNFGGVSNSSTSMNIMAGAGAGGSISPSGAVSVVYGGSQTFSISPDTGYRITDVKVDGDSMGAISTYTFTMVTSSRAIYAAFAKNPVITASAGSNGAISPSGAVSVAYGSTQNFTITADPGYRVAEVFVDGNPQGASTQYMFSNVDTDHTISATFVVNPVISASASTGGSITPSGLVSVMYGSDQPFVFNPDPGHHLTDVVVDNVPQGPLLNYTFPAVTANHNISATFAINQYTINATAGPNGAIAPAGITTVDYGGNQSYTITPDTGYQVSDIFIDSVSIGSATNYTFTNIAANHTIAATFAINQLTINATAGPNGSIAPSGSTLVDYGGSQSYTITPDTGYHVADIVVDSISQGPVTNYTFTNVTSDHTITAAFAINQYTINATAGPNGSIAPSGSTLVDYGGSQSYTISPATGYRVSDVVVDSVSLGPITNYTFTNVVANHTIAATFLINAPVANFTATPLSGGVPLTVTFTDLSTNNPTSWLWNFGELDNGTSVLQNPTHTYFQPGNYSVELTATNDGGSNKTVRLGYIFTYYPAVANFTGTPTTGSYGLSGLTVQFSDHSTGGVSSWNWDFGDGSYSGANTQQNPGHTYAVGRYSVNLTVANTFSSSYLLRENYINVTPNAPTSDFETYDNDVDMNPLDQGFAPLSVFFYDLSSDDPTSWTWNFGDGNVTTITKDGSHEYGDIYHTFTNPGTYNVSLTANNAWGSDTSYKTITATGLTISASSGPNGAVTPSGETTVNYGATPTYTITPDVGYHVANVLVNGTSVGAVTSYTFPPVTTNKTISATFAINTYTVTSSVASGQGTISPLGTTTYNYGATPTYTITKNATYSIGTVLVDGSSVGAVSSYTFPALAANHTISASFTKNPSVQIYYQPFTATTGWPYDSWTRSSTTYVTLSSTIRNGSTGRSVRDAYTAYFGRTIPTTGYDEIYVRYAWATAGLTSTQYATAQDSTSGSYAEFARQTGNQASLTIVNTSRPDAGDNANYALRWQIYASQTTDYLYVDDVQVFGTPI